MGRSTSISPASRPDSEAEFIWPFGRIDYLHRSDIREAAYEVFFMSCRSSPGFSSRNSMTYPLSGDSVTGEDSRRDGPVSPGAKGANGAMRDGSGSPGAKAGGTMMVVNSRIKRALGLKSRRQSLMRRMNQTGATAQGGMTSPGRVRRPMTSAEIMRQQMRVTEQSDSRLRKTLMRTFVGQVHS